MSETSEKLDHTLRAYGRLERKHGERGRELTAVKAERDYWRNIAQTLAPEHPVVAIPTDTLEAISARAEEAEAERDYLLERQAFAVWGYWEKHGDTDDVARIAAALLLRPSTAKKAIALAHELRLAGVVSTREKDK